MDVIGLSLVTIGEKASVETQRLFEGATVSDTLAAVLKTEPD